MSPYQVIVETVEQPREYVLSDEPSKEAAEARVREVLADPPEGVWNAYILRRHW